MQSFQETDYTKRFDLSLWKKLLHIAKPYHKNLYIVAAFMSVSAILDVLFPMMTSYAIDLRSITQSRGTFSFHFVRYEEAPPAAQQKAIDDAKAIQEEG